MQQIGGRKLMKNRTLVALALFALLIGVLTFVGAKWLRPDKAAESHESPTAGELPKLPMKAIGGLEEHPSVVDRASDPTPKKAETTKNPEKALADSPKTEGIPEDSGIEIVLRFVDEQGQPLPGLAFRYCLDNDDKLFELIGQSPSSEASELLKTPGTADTEGIFRVPSELATAEPAAIRIQLNDPTRSIIKAPSFPARLPRGVVGYKLNAGKAEIRVLVANANRREFEVRYEDGTYFYGEVRTYYRKGKKRAGGDQTFRLDGRNASVVLEGVPEDVGVGLLCISAKLGFVARSDFTYPPDAPHFQICEVKRSETPQAGIRVKVEGVDSNQSYRVLIINGQGSACGGDDKTGAGIYEWLAPSPRERFIVQVRFQGKGAAVFQSDAIALKIGEFVTVIAEPKQPVTYKAIAVDSRGAPLWPALLTSNTLSYYDFSFAKRGRDEPSVDEQSGRALSDKQGRLTLSGVASSVSELLLDADGYNPTVIRVSGAPGQTVDLGTITLSEASGGITVKLVNRVDGFTYRCTLLQPFGSPVATATPTKGDSFSFAKLPLREYCVFVDAGNGLRGVSTVVVLSENSTSAVIELDVGKCESPK